MKNKQFKGKAIYNPSGKAGEYSYWACNFYNGCSVMCSYCFNKKGMTSKTLGGNEPKLKKCFENESHALEIFKKEISLNITELQKHGLFFSFTTDPMLPETIDLTKSAMGLCNFYKIPIKILTKRADWMNEDFIRNHIIYRDIMAFGFTLTGHDDLEPGASINKDRIDAMKRLHISGYKTFASIEPIIDFESSWRMIDESWDSCDLFKIGLQSGSKYDKSELIKFISKILSYRAKREIPTFHIAKLYFKDSLLKQAGIERDKLPLNCVTREYNLFTGELMSNFWG